MINIYLNASFRIHLFAFAITSPESRSHAKHYVKTLHIA